MIDHPLLAHYDGKAYQKALAPFLLEKKPDTIIFGATPFGRDLAPRLAAEFVCGVTADVTELSADTEKGLVIWSRPAMDGNIMADIVSPDYRPQVGTVRPGIFKYPQADASRTGEVISLPVSLEEKDLGTVLKEIIAGEKDSHPVENAKVVVAGAAASVRRKNGRSSMSSLIFWGQLSAVAVRSQSSAGSRIATRSARPARA